MEIGSSVLSLKVEVGSKSNFFMLVNQLLDDKLVIHTLHCDEDYVNNYVCLRADNICTRICSYFKIRQIDPIIARQSKTKFKKVNHDIPRAKCSDEPYQCRCFHT